jgi:hypothetical protein
MDITTDKCPLWGTRAKVVGVGLRYVIESPRAGGRYAISDSVAGYDAAFIAAMRQDLTDWIVRQHMGGEAEPLISSSVVAQLADIDRRLSLKDRVDRFFTYLVRQRFDIGDQWYFSAPYGVEEIPQAQMLLAWSGCDGNQIHPFLHLLKEEGLVDLPVGSTFRLTSDGYHRLEQYERGTVATRSAFVAMWFGAEMTEVYDTAIAPAIIRAGFEPIRIDRKEHNRKIDDEIMADIRRSRFVVADFTCGSYLAEGGSSRLEPRGGVYYEAGFAMGLNIPVIWCCRADQINDLHFDTRQFAHIVWTEPADLEPQLYNRIRNVIPNAAQPV